MALRLLRIQASGVMGDKRRIFLTGATGVMGGAAMREIMPAAPAQGYSLTVLARPSKCNHAKLAPYERRGLKVIWGDLLNADYISRGVEGADIVLHVGGMVSPAADLQPAKTLRVNVAAMDNVIAAALKEQQRGHMVEVVYIGSVAQMGWRGEPFHWGRVGDPVRTAVFDMYALSKSLSEFKLVNSGLRRWVSLRQTGILHGGLLLNANSQTAFHVPVRGALEWVTDRDSGRLLERMCRSDVPEDFWCDYYNIGGGEAYRLSNYAFEKIILSALGCPPPEKVFDARWFATRNFHGMWYTDSDRLEELFHFRSGDSPEEFLRSLRGDLPWWLSMAKLAPAACMKMYMKTVASGSPNGPLSWRRSGDKEKIEAYFGSQELWDAQPGWEGIERRPLDRRPLLLDHGYDENMEIGSMTARDLDYVAQFRGGRHLQTLAPGTKENPTAEPTELWRCSQGHEFRATRWSVVRGGHWCPECLRLSATSLQWNKKITESAPFLLQLNAMY